MADNLNREFYTADMDHLMICTSVGATPLTDYLQTPNGDWCISFVLQGTLPHRGWATADSAPVALSPEIAAQLIAELFGAADRAGWGPRLRAEVDQQTQGVRKFWAENPDRPEGPLSELPDA